MKIVHRIGVADIPDSVTPIAPTINCSLIVSSARVLNKLFINPMKRTPEVAFVVNDSTKVTTVSSFDHTSVASSIGGGPSLSQQQQNNNPGLSIWSNVSLKTETSMACDEFDHYAWRDDRCCNGTNDDANGSNFDGDDVPPNVNEEVCLVFAIKDVKAFLQFCSQASSSMDEEMPVNVYFEWGGRPTIFECEGESFISRLIMATLDHRLLQQHDTTTNNTNSANIGSANG
uniref:Uncharacterized protein n=1 Tax=Proboscia inermis TaxID=420281 RepID=A0A7S0CLV7_9STRA